MSDIVSVVISRQTTPIQEATFSIPMIFSADTPLDEDFEQGSSRSYSSAEGVAVDFEDTSDTYKAVEALMAQENQPAEFRIFLRSDPVAQEKTITFTGPPASGHSFGGTINGTVLSSTAYGVSGSATLDALADKIELVEGVDTCTVLGNVLTVVFDEEWDGTISISSSGTGAPTATVATLEAGHTIGNDITDANTEGSDWYFFLATSSNKGAGLASGRTLGSLIRLGEFMTNETACYDSGSTNDIMAKAKAAAFGRMAYVYTHDVTEYITQAWAGRCLPKKPGQTRFGLRTLNNITASPLTENQADAILDKNGNCYIEYGGVNITQEGRVASGDYLDVVRDIDYLQSQITFSIFSLLIRLEKIPFTDEGIQLIVTELKKVLDRMYKEGIIKNDYTVGFPKAADVSVNNRANRILPDITFVANLQGGIEKINSIDGVVKV